MGRVEHLEPKTFGDLSERATDHLGTERRAAHPEQNRVGEPLGPNGVGERVQLGRVLEHRLGDVSHPSRSSISGPGPPHRVGVAAPDPLRDGLIHRALDPRSDVVFELTREAEPGS